jgi:autoinducer 2-degrading protein
MHILIVHGHVKPESLEAFVAATKINATESAKEPGIVQFDFLQQEDDPTKIVLIEVYRDKEAPLKHKETRHYLEWNEKVADMWVTPRTRAWYRHAAV